MTDFTIILPVYNGEKTIKRAVLSVLNQSYKNFRFYIINDGSTDSTLQICEQYAKKDLRIEIYTKSNGGVASSRNTGVQLASSRNIDTKIVWIDADDELELNLLDKLNKIFCEYPTVDAVCYDFDLLSNDKVIENRYICQIFNKKGLVSGKELLKKILLGDINNYMWAFAADIKCYKNITFPNGKRYEDLATLYKIAANVKTCYLIDYKGYKYYFDNPESISKNFTVKDAENLLDIISDMSKNFRNDTMNEYVVVFQSIYLTNIVISLVDNIDELSYALIKKAKLKFKEIKKDLKFKVFKQSRYVWKLLMMKLNLIVPIYKAKGLLKR